MPAIYEQIFGALMMSNDGLQAVCLRGPGKQQDHPLHEICFIICMLFNRYNGILIRLDEAELNLPHYFSCQWRHLQFNRTDA